jgi:hypothetical protein
VISLTLNQFLSLYLWFLLAGLLFFLLLIARLYGKFSGEKTYSRSFLLPVVFFGVAAVRYAGIDQIAGDAWGDVFSAIGGGILLVLCVNLYHLMILQRQKE